MAEERFVSTRDLSTPSSSILSISSPDSTASSASSDDITGNGNSSRGFSPPSVPDGDGGPLFVMKSLRDSLPSRKRGLSNFFNGKSQSFTSLADVKCAEDLAKPEKKFKSSHSKFIISFHHQTLPVGVAESMEISGKASFGREMSEKKSPFISLQVTAIASKTNTLTDYRSSHE